MTVSQQMGTRGVTLAYVRASLEVWAWQVDRTYHMNFYGERAELNGEESSFWNDHGGYETFVDIISGDITQRMEEDEQGPFPTILCIAYKDMAMKGDAVVRKLQPLLKEFGEYPDEKAFIYITCGERVFIHYCGYYIFTTLDEKGSQDCYQKWWLPSLKP